MKGYCIRITVEQRLQYGYFVDEDLQWGETRVILRIFFDAFEGKIKEYLPKLSSGSERKTTGSPSLLVGKAWPGWLSQSIIVRKIGDTDIRVGKLTFNFVSAKCKSKFSAWFSTNSGVNSAAVGGIKFGRDEVRQYWLCNSKARIWP